MANSCLTGYVSGSAVNKQSCIRGGEGMTAFVAGGVLSASVLVGSAPADSISPFVCTDSGLSAPIVDSDFIKITSRRLPDDTFVYQPVIKIAPNITDCDGSTAINMLKEASIGMEVSVTDSPCITAIPVGEDGCSFEWNISPRDHLVQDKYGLLFSGSQGIGYSDPPDIGLEKFLLTSVNDHFFVKRSSVQLIDGQKFVTLRLALTDKGRETLQPTPLNLAAFNSGTLAAALGDGTVSGNSGIAPATFSGPSLTVPGSNGTAGTGAGNTSTGTQFSGAPRAGGQTSGR
jgi:hypothetical protein